MEPSLSRRDEHLRGTSRAPGLRLVIGERLRRAGVVGEPDLEAALAEHVRSGERLGAVLVRLKLATERQVAEALAAQFGLVCVDLSDHPLPADAVSRIPRDVALKRNCIAIALDKNKLTVAMSDPVLFSLVQDLEFHTGCHVIQAVATRADIAEAIERGYPERGLALAARAGTIDEPSAPDRNDRAAPAATPIVEMVDLLIASAVKSGASDIHVEPTDTGVVVRHRLDGLLKVAMDLPGWVLEGLVSRIKIIAGLDIAEKRLPQDGRIRTTGGHGGSVDLRVSTLRTVRGEKVVLRVLDHGKGAPSLESLGLSAPALAQIQRFLRHQHGMILVVGPTGSGKTTTLSSALASLRSERTNIVTIEDPVEYQITGVNQTQINAGIDLTFANALRAILRQDPDVVLVGEIRDQETARIAMQAAQTGHLVLSTLHTDDAASCVVRLGDIGIERYVVASALLGVVAQRLVRRLCVHCKCAYVPEAETLRALDLGETAAAATTFYRAAGCDECRGTGYRGRIGIYEVMTVTDELRQLIVQARPDTPLRTAARNAGMCSLAEDGLLKVKAGLTSPDELLRVVTEVRPAVGACAECGEPMAADFVACPRCGRRAREGCPHCGRSTRPGWQFCPYCSEGLEVFDGHPQLLRRLGSGPHRDGRGDQARVPPPDREVPPRQGAPPRR